MERKESEGSKGDLSKHVRPDKRDPNTAEARNTDVESQAGNRNPTGSARHNKGGLKERS